MTTSGPAAPVPDADGRGGGAVPGLAAALDRAVAAGVITAEQAADVLALPAGAPPAPPVARRSVVAEVLGYLGAAVALIAAVSLGGQLLGVLSAAGRVGVIALVTVVTLVGGAALHGRGGAAGRLASVLWAVAVAAAAGTAGLAADELLDWGGTSVALAAAGTALAVALALWWRERGPLQEVVLFVAVIATVVSAILRADPDLGDVVGYAVWAVGVAWLVVALVRRVPASTAGGVLGTIAMVAGPLAAGSGRDAFLVVGVLAVAAVLGWALHRRIVGVAVAGIAGLFVLIPATLSELFGTAALPLWIALAAGLTAVLVAVWLSRRHPPGPGPSGPGPAPAAGAGSPPAR